MAKQTVEAEILTIYKLPKRKKSEDEQAYFERLAKSAVDEGSDEQWEKLSEAAANWANEVMQTLKEQPGEALPPLPNGKGTDSDAAALQAEPEAEVEQPVKGKKAPGKAKATKVAKAEPKVEPKVTPAKAEQKVKAKAEPKAKPAKAEPKPEPNERGWRGKPGKVEPETAPEPTAATVAKKPRVIVRTSNGKGIYAATQEYLVKHPNATTEETAEALVKAGIPKDQMIEKLGTVASVRGHTRDTMKLVQRIHKVDLGIA